MSTSTNNAWLTWPRAASARVEADQLCVELTDGREITVPLNWFDWLVSATQNQREGLQIVEDGAGIWWEPLEDGVSVPSLLGLPEYPPPDPNVRTYIVAYRFEDGVWVAEVRGTNFSTFGRTVAVAKRRARELLGAYLDVKDLGSAGIEVVDEVQWPSAV
jgi:predicted RNase H-like HicB family nuclease